MRKPRGPGEARPGPPELLDHLWAQALVALWIISIVGFCLRGQLLRFLRQPLPAPAPGP